MNNKSSSGFIEDICSLESVNSRINDRIKSLSITDELAIANAKICMYQEEIISTNKIYEATNFIKDRAQELDERILTEYEDLLKKEIKDLDEERCWTIYYRAYSTELKTALKEIVDKETFIRICNGAEKKAEEKRTKWEQYFENEHMKHELFCNKEDSDD